MLLAMIEHDQGIMAEASMQMLTFAGQTAKDAGLEMAAVLIGQESQSLAEDIKTLGVAKIISVVHDRLADYAPDAWAASLAGLMESKDAQILMAPSTDRGNDVLARVGARKGLPMAANCVEVQPGQPFKVVRQRWGGSLLEEAELIGPPWLLTSAMHVVEPVESSSPVEVSLEEYTPQLADKDFRVTISKRTKTEIEGVSLKTARIVIGGGRGMGGPEGYSVLEELAELIGAAVGGSRVATNNGWRSHTDQIGLTGNRIAPDLYIACGISGAIQHLVGCKGAKKILVINNDPEAAFFDKADYGIIGDLFEVIPAITEEAKKVSG